MHHDHGGHHEDFDEFYAGGPQWSGNPNEALVHEASDLTPGRVLDIGAGEGADAVWLAEHGWQVTALEPVAAAVERGRELAARRGVDKQITFEAATLSEFLAGAGGQSFDLICAFYFPAPVPDGEVRALAELLAPGGTLLWVDHDWEGQHPGRMNPATMESLLEGLAARSELRRSTREVSHGAGAHHHEDLILRAER
ncbi:MAG: class I SAM-dependent methyltransferase [Corynebacterium marinum]|jgi:SAM-dependent methyltransferase|uniref:Class I SAM-dependent methyltransferase n=1 Tax=Corynebacterium marinum TaxID=349751 RepID=A0A847HB81_9CORY|nr:class I SAM-dependent methyltransferase [Corynebacterium marinum]